MKNLFYVLTGLCLMGMTASCVLYEWGTVDPDIVDPEVVSGGLLVEPSELTVSSFSGTHSVSYTIVTEVEGAELEAPESSETWVNSFDVSEDGVISFNVDSNSGEERSSTVTLRYADEVATFTVTQNNGNVLLFSDLDNNYWTATFCHFDKDSTMLSVNSSTLENYRTGKDYETYAWFADNYVNDYNNDPNNTDTITDEYALSFEFTISALTGDYAGYSYVTAHDMEFSVGHMTVSNVSGYIPGQQLIVTKVDGVCDYEELEDGTIEMTVYNYANSYYTTIYSYVFEKDGDEVLYRVTNIDYTDYIDAGMYNFSYDYYGNYDYFPFAISDYYATETYIPFKWLKYRMKKTTYAQVASDRGWAL